MKIYFSVLSFVAFLFLFNSSSLYAQYDSEGNHFADSLKSSPPVVSTNAKHKVIFDAPQDTIYIYHLVSEGESIEFILNMYQLCAPCFAEWNSYIYSEIKTLYRQKIYAGEYLKVALKSEYYKGFPSDAPFRYQYADIKKNTYLYRMSEHYGITILELRKLNNLNEYVYTLPEDTRMIVGKTLYKYVCPCKKTVYNDIAPKK